MAGAVRQLNYLRLGTLHVMNVAKQSGSSDCALFAMPTIICLALEIDLLRVLYDREQLRPHLVKIVEADKVTPLPVLKHLRPATRVSKVEVRLIFCHCRLPDNGDEMICCDTCDEWFHVRCIAH